MLPGEDASELTERGFTTVLAPAQLALALLILLGICNRRPTVTRHTRIAINSLFAAALSTSLLWPTDVSAQQRSRPSGSRPAGRAVQTAPRSYNNQVLPAVERLPSVLRLPAVLRLSSVLLRLRLPPVLLLPGFLPRFLRLVLLGRLWFWRRVWIRRRVRIRCRVWLGAVRPVSIRAVLPPGL